jgi:acetolactate synthase-1/2/3 large subunit
MARLVDPTFNIRIVLMRNLDLFYDSRYSHTRMTNPDFVMLAKAMYVHAIRCESAADLPAKMKEFLEYDGSKPVLLECKVETDEHVYPMVRLERPVYL